MTATAAILVRTSAAFLVAVAGGVLSAIIGRTHKQLCALISLGAGTLLGITVCAIVPECLETLRWWQLIPSAASGYVLFSLVSRHVFHVCPACAASHFDEALSHRFGEIAVAMMVALAIHCTVDGLALAVGHEETSRAIDLSLTFAICVHKAPEGLALGALLLGAGFGKARMLALVMAVESTTILGGLLGYFALHNLPAVWLGVALANAGGGFLYLATHAVLGEVFKHSKSVVLVSFAGGFLSMAVLILIFHLKD